MLYNTKLLSVVFIGLFALYAITKVVKNNQGSRSFKTQIASVDTAQVQTISLYPQIAQQKEIKFTRSKQGWVAQQDKLQAVAERGKIESLLSDLRSVKPQRLVANDQSKWATYQLTDSLCTRVKLLGNNGQELMTLLIGKAGTGGESFVRLPNDNEVYAIGSLLAANANKGFNDWRNQDVLKFNFPAINKISFTYQGDSSFTVAKDKSTWKMGEDIADSTLVTQYLNSISAKRNDQFADGFTPQQQPTFILQLSGVSQAAGAPGPRLIVQGFEANNEVYIRTSINPNAIFLGKKSGLFNAIFKAKADFIKKEAPDKKEEEK
ncbi:hypothetical protein BKI52_37745 [marine bacterium AO1-C]|nr:hypothetical protein BKI52_37745 [marine bacterium AO1-C]